MPATRRRFAWTPRRRKGVAIQLILGGVLLMGVPALLGESVVAAGCRALSPIAWLMTVAGAVLLLFLPGRRSRSPDPTSSPAPSGDAARSSDPPPG